MKFRIGLISFLSLNRFFPILQNNLVLTISFSVYFPSVCSLYKILHEPIAEKLKIQFFSHSLLITLIFMNISVY